MTVFNRIKEVAELRGYNLQQVALKSGMKSENAIYRYNQGVTPRDSTLKSIANTLNVSIEYLKGETDDINSKPKQSVDIADPNVIKTFEGREIPEEDLELIKRLLRGKE